MTAMATSLVLAAQPPKTPKEASTAAPNTPRTPKTPSSSQTPKSPTALSANACNGNTNEGEESDSSNSACNEQTAHQAINRDHDRREQEGGDSEHEKEPSAVKEARTAVDHFSDDAHKEVKQFCEAEKIIDVFNSTAVVEIVASTNNSNSGISQITSASTNERNELDTLPKRVDDSGSCNINMNPLADTDIFSKSSQFGVKEHAPEFPLTPTRLSSLCFGIKASSPSNEKSSTMADKPSDSPNNMIDIEKDSSETPQPMNVYCKSDFCAKNPSSGLDTISAKSNFENNLCESSKSFVVCTVDPANVSPTISFAATSSATEIIPALVNATTASASNVVFSCPNAADVKITSPVKPDISQNPVLRAKNLPILTTNLAKTVNTVFPPATTAPTSTKMQAPRSSTDMVSCFSKLSSSLRPKVDELLVNLSRDYVEVCFQASPGVTEMLTAGLLVKMRAMLRESVSVLSRRIGNLPTLEALGFCKDSASSSSQEFSDYKNESDFSYCLRITDNPAISLLASELSIEDSCKSLRAALEPLMTFDYLTEDEKALRLDQSKVEGSETCAGTDTTFMSLQNAACNESLLTLSSSLSLKNKKKRADGPDQVSATIPPAQQNCKLQSQTLSPSQAKRCENSNGPNTSTAIHRNFSENLAKTTASGSAIRPAGNFSKYAASASTNNAQSISSSSSSRRPVQSPALTDEARLAEAAQKTREAAFFAAGGNVRSWMRIGTRALAVPKKSSAGGGNAAADSDSKSANGLEGHKSLKPQPPTPAEIARRKLCYFAASSPAKRRVITNHDFREVIMRDAVLGMGMHTGNAAARAAFIVVNKKCGYLCCSKEKNFQLNTAASERTTNKTSPSKSQFS